MQASSTGQTSFMGFATGFVVIHNLRRRVIRRPVSIAEYYVRYGTFWPDFLASLPTIAEVSLVSDLPSRGCYTNNAARGLTRC